MNLTNTLLIVYCITIVDTYVEPQRNLLVWLIKARPVLSCLSFSEMGHFLAYGNR